MKRILPLSFALAVAATASADSNWRMHPTFDEEVGRVVETPEYTYFTSRTMPLKTGRIDAKSLFRYDKEGDELQTLSTDNLLSFNNVLDIQYCPQKGYLVVVYTNYDMDFIFDNGDVVNCPAYRLATINQSKNVNGITVNPEFDRVYIATDFGYVALNDEKFEISESRIYGEPLKSMARIGDTIVAIHGNDIIAAPASDRRMSLSDYEKVASLEKPYILAPLSADMCLVAAYKNKAREVSSISLQNGKIAVTPILTSSTLYNTENNKNGVTMASAKRLYQFTPDGKFSATDFPEEQTGISAGSYDMSEVWQGMARKGIRSGKPGADGTSWTMTRDYMLPDAPAPFISTHMLVHPSKGLMLVNYGYDYNFNDSYSHSSPALLSAYRDSRWSNLSPAYTNPEQTKMMRSPNGFAIDPDNPDLIYMTSVYNGLARINLSDPSDVIHLSRPSDTGSKLPGFVEFVPDQTGKNKWGCQFTAPEFDYYGNLWTMYIDLDNQNPERLYLYCWTPEDRKATSSATSLVAPKVLEVKGFLPNNIDKLLPLRHSSNRNYLVYTTGQYDSPLVVIDTNGTPLDSSDDTVGVIKKTEFVDQEGSSISPTHIRCMWEDPATGNVWIGHDGGVFYLDPEQAFSSSPRVTRIKIARNDGTNLADYLLDGVSVNKITRDGNGRKWFATLGGVLCTSSDGREIVGEFNSSNSPMPDDATYGLEYIPANNSMMISTGMGLVEYFLSGSSSAGSEESVKVYPNPVRPDYLGYVTIEGAPSGGIVKIVDASGNIVKELGRANGSEVKWDVTNHQFKRVSSGVYYVLVSSGKNDTEFAAAGKILVVN